MSKTMVTAACAAALILQTQVVRATGCGGPGAAQVSLEVATQFVSGVDIPESVTTDAAGNLYVSVGNTIRRRTPDGEVGVFTTLPLPIFALGVKVGPDGCVYNVSTSLSEIAGAFVWRTCRPDSTELFGELDQRGGPNDLAFDADGNLFVTDPVLGRVWKLDAEGKAEVLLEHPLLEGDPANPALLFRPLGVNGIALHDHGHFLYLSNTDQGSILRVDLRAQMHAPSVFVRDLALRGADGIAFDRTGTLFVAVNGRDALVAVSPGRQLRVVQEGGILDAPSSIVFGATLGDHHQLYLTNSAFGRTLALKPGTPRPALLTTRVAAPGLPLF